MFTLYSADLLIPALPSVADVTQVSNALLFKGPQAFNKACALLRKKNPEWATFFEALYTLKFYYGTEHPMAGKPDYEKLKSLFATQNLELCYYAQELVYQYFHEGDWSNLTDQQNLLTPKILSLGFIEDILEKFPPR